jgi:hypothetical protein
MDEAEDDEYKPPARQSVFLLALLWTSWLVVIFLSTMVEVADHSRQLVRMSSLQRFPYHNRWD